MTEDIKHYPLDGNAPETLKSFARRSCCLPWIHPDFKQPTNDEIKILFELTGWQTKTIAQLLGVHYTPKNGSATIRKWKNDPTHGIPYSAWRLALIYAGVVHPEDDLQVVAKCDQ